MFPLISLWPIYGLRVGSRSQDLETHRDLTLLLDHTYEFQIDRQLRDGWFALRLGDSHARSGWLRYWAFGPAAPGDHRRVLDRPAEDSPPGGNRLRRRPAVQRPSRRPISRGVPALAGSSRSHSNCFEHD